MSAHKNGDGHSDVFRITGALEQQINQVNVTLSDEQVAAVEGWRAANRIDDRSDAVRELVRLGLLSEIARVYRLVSRIRQSDDMAEARGDLAS